jgi:Polyketide cyclase / dehydrase and lipid transport
VAVAYYSAIFDQPAGEVWQEIRDFGKYTVWVDEVDETVIEQDRPGDAVGAVRRVQLGERRIRHRLLAHSDIDRSYTYEFCDPDSAVPSGYRATLRVTPVVDGDRSFVEWFAGFDSEAGEQDRWVDQFRSSFAKWLGSLRSSLAKNR